MANICLITVMCVTRPNSLAVWNFNHPNMRCDSWVVQGTWRPTYSVSPQAFLTMVNYHCNWLTTWSWFNFSYHESNILGLSKSKMLNFIQITQCQISLFEKLRSFSWNFMEVFLVKWSNKIVHKMELLWIPN